MGWDDGFCAACGTSPFKVVCPNCHHLPQQNSAFCTRCGHRLRVSSRATADLYSQTVDQPPNERKYLTILCADLQQSTELTAAMDPEEAVSRLEPALAAMRAAVRRHGGIVSKELGDGLIALFGAPKSDADHAVMACSSALELVRSIALLEDPGIRVRVGIHSGYVIVRMTSGDYSSVYEAGGPAMAMANRLETAADPGHILASESSQRLAEGLVWFENSGPRFLKGFPQPVPTYKVTGLTGFSRWRVRSGRSLAKFIGRSSELSALGHAAEATINGTGQIVSIVGDPGIGKSRLVHEFVDQLAKAGWRIIETECSPINQRTPYITLKNLLLSLDPSFKNPTFGAGNYLSDRSEFPELWISAIDAVLDRPITDTEWGELEPRLRGRTIIDAFRALIESAVSEQPVALLLEDLHWVDSASDVAIEALGLLAARHQLLILLTSRPDAEPEWVSRQNVTRLWLPPLDSAAANALLDALLGQAADLLDLKARILRHTGRVPLFIEEVTRRLVDTGTVVGGWGCFALNKPSDQLGVPPTVQGVIAGRIDRLDNREKTLIQAASAIGPRADLTLLRAVVRMPEEALQSSLASVDAAGLLMELTILADQVYEFPHDLIREVAYDSMPGQHREQLHKRILHALEVASQHCREDVAEILTHHALHAKAWPEAGSYAQLAAHKSMTRSALQEAARYFEIAIDAVDRLPVSVERERRAIDLRVEARLAIPAIGKLQRWIELAAEAEKRSAAIGDVGRQVASLVDRASALNFYSTPLEAIPINETAARQAEALNAPGWLSVAEYGLGQAYLTAGRYREAEKLFGRAHARLTDSHIQIPIGTTRPRLSLLCCMMKSVAHVALGEGDHAEVYQRLASDTAAETKRPYDIIAANYGRGVFQLAWGSFEEAFAAFDQALTLARQHDVRQFAPVVACQLGNLFLQQQQATKAQKILREARAEAEALGHLLSVLRASIYLALVMSRLEGPADALFLLRTAQDRAARQGLEGIRAEALLYEATILSSSNSLDTIATKKCLLDVIFISTRLEARPQEAAARALFGSILARQGDVSSAADELQQAAFLFDTMNFAGQLARVRLLLDDIKRGSTAVRGV
jgi:class 3 adenylate cyclase/tetratricopeptide (TPR) repeat protein